jgi:putative holliday junction resolvase
MHWLRCMNCGGDADRLSKTCSNLQPRHDLTRQWPVTATRERNSVSRITNRAQSAYLEAQFWSLLFSPSIGSRQLRWGLGYRAGVRALGLDVGSKTIGVALSDELGLAAHGLAVIARHGTAPDVAAVAEQISRHAVGAVVVGIPFELSGREGPRARRVRVFFAALQAACGATVEWHEQDERFSTRFAERALLQADLSRAKRKRVIDQQAAAVILQGWLDARRPPT